MNPVRRKMAVALLACGVLGLAWMIMAGAMIWTTLDAPQQAWLGDLMRPRLVLLGLCLLMGLGVVAYALNRWILPQAFAVARFVEQARVRIDQADLPPLTGPDDASLDGLAEVLNALVEQRDSLRSDVAGQVVEASRSIEQERNRLAALMAELNQSVVVCNRDGRILLFNPQARELFRQLWSTPELRNGSLLMGLGRPIRDCLDRHLVDHALDMIQHQLLRGAQRPTAQFVTTLGSGQLLKVQMSPVIEAGGDRSRAPCLEGFILMLDKLTRHRLEDSQQVLVLQELTQSLRISLARLQQEADPPASSPATRAALTELAAEMSQQVDLAQTRMSQSLSGQWPLEELLATDLLDAARRRIEQHTLCRISWDEPARGLTIRVDSFSLLLALRYLSGRLADEFQTRSVHLRLKAESTDQAVLDLVWSGQALSTETVMTWELDAMPFDGAAGELTVRDVVQRHGGAFWFERERVRHEAFFRFRLPMAAAQDPPPSSLASAPSARQTFYDFDLFEHDGEPGQLDDARLSELTFTVFDTETTGLRPSQGDEIIQIGAVRISSGKLRREECFEQLINPGRGIPSAGIPIHGITTDMVQGQPSIDAVLPAFHAFARDTVLVAHNAAFDMRFLQLKESSIGLRFDQPVLDTLMLSALVQPNQTSHRLDALAERFNIPVIGRHTALGDAMVTAQVFLRLIPMLKAMGINTLGQARRAARETHFARLKY